MATGLVYSPRYLKHMTGFDHPERPRRVSYVAEKLAESGLLNRLHLIEPTPCDLMWLLETHHGRYIEHLRAMCDRAPTSLDMDTVICRQSFEVAHLAVGGVLKACDLVMEGRLTNAFCLVRPPGHHAEADHAMGFCLFSNVAVAAKYLRLNYGLGRVLIIDWDVHHGNGTQQAFYGDPSVFYFSIHQFPFFPGTGAADERGQGPGTGTTLNVPMRAGAGDAEWLTAFRNQLVPAVDDFKPDFILISAGFDAHWEDSIAQQRVTDDGFAEMTAIVVDLAARHAKRRLVSVLEGGYDINSLSRAIHRHLLELLR